MSKDKTEIVCSLFQKYKLHLLRCAIASQVLFLSYTWTQHERVLHKLRPVTRGSAGGLEKLRRPWKNAMHNSCFRTCYRCKIWPPSENSSPHLVTGLIKLHAVVRTNEIQARKERRRVSVVRKLILLSFYPVLYFVILPDKLEDGAK